MYIHPLNFLEDHGGHTQGLNNIFIHLNDTLVSWKTPEDCHHHLEAVLHQLEHAGLSLKHLKRLFMLLSVEYLGFWMFTRGLQPTSEKVQVI